KVANGLTMGVAVFFVLTASSFIVSLLGDAVPRRVRIPVFMLVIATFVTLVYMFLRAFFMPLSQALGAYVGLIITNCVILGRLESFSSENTPWDSVVDAAGVATGFGLALIAMSVVRELLGFGTLFGVQVLGAGWTQWVSMILAPGGFLVLGLLIWIQRAISPVEEG
ncbi:NADH:ubiquinone reductase (Na(+)-transporting) subunit D, partial [Candidatus Bipolaricaulota bacterium]|nr:NADH:ubiquinone reductase (Na(+)-transporting) subunit D [Candidatus Bipolaricaulota bacterium]